MLSALLITNESSDVLTFVDVTCVFVSAAAVVVIDGGGGMTLNCKSEILFFEDKNKN
jgi:hypothetical protein